MFGPTVASAKHGPRIPRTGEVSANWAGGMNGTPGKRRRSGCVRLALNRELLQFPASQSLLVLRPLAVAPRCAGGLMLAGKGFGRRVIDWRADFSCREVANSQNAAAYATRRGTSGRGPPGGGLHRARSVAAGTPTSPV